jgi:hypothetical protein
MDAEILGKYSSQKIIFYMGRKKILENILRKWRIFPKNLPK